MKMIKPVVCVTIAIFICAIDSGCVCKPAAKLDDAGNLCLACEVVNFAGNDAQPVLRYWITPSGNTPVLLSDQVFILWEFHASRGQSGGLISAGGANTVWPEDLETYVLLRPVSIHRLRCGLSGSFDLPLLEQIRTARNGSFLITAEICVIEKATGPKRRVRLTWHGTATTRGEENASATAPAAH